MPYSIDELNQMQQEEFVAALGDVFEHTPAIAQKAWKSRPFSHASDLHQSMVELVNDLRLDEQLALIRAHPDLGSKAKMADASVKEQAGVGLDRLGLSDYEQFHQLNQAYKEKFEFPFIIAVKNHTKESILYAFRCRLENSKEAEIAQSLEEISQIAWFRLAELVQP